MEVEGGQEDSLKNLGFGLDLLMPLARSMVAPSIKSRVVDVMADVLSRSIPRA